MTDDERYQRALEVCPDWALGTIIRQINRDGRIQWAALAALADARVAYHHDPDGSAADLVEAIDECLATCGIDVLPRLDSSMQLPLFVEDDR